MKCMEIKPMPYRVGEVDPLSKLPSLRSAEIVFLKNLKTFFLEMIKHSLKCFVLFESNFNSNKPIVMLHLNLLPQFNVVLEML